MSTDSIVWRVRKLKSLAGSAIYAGGFQYRFLLRPRRWLSCALAFVSVNAFTAFAQQTNLAVIVRHAPNLNGSGLIEGSVQQLLGENVTLNGGFTLTGDLLVPGTA